MSSGRPAPLHAVTCSMRFETADDGTVVKRLFDSMSQPCPRAGKLPLLGRLTQHEGIAARLQHDRSKAQPGTI